MNNTQKPNNLELAQKLNQSGIINVKIGQLTLAEDFFKQATNAYPTYAEAYYNLAMLYYTNGHIEGNVNKAEKNFRKATKYNNTYFEAYLNLGLLFRDVKIYDHAIIQFEQAYKLHPTNSTLLINLSFCYRMTGQCVEAEKIDKIILSSDQVIDLPFSNLYRVDNPKINLQTAQFWANNIISSINPAIKYTFDLQRLKQKSRINIGYISSDFHQEHPVAHIIKDMFALHNRKLFNVYGYSYRTDFKKRENVIGRQIKYSFDVFTNTTGLNHKQIADVIANHQIDILVDLQGFTQDAQLQTLALRPAPIQITYLGFPGSTGASFFDYNIVDEIIITKEARSYYSEKLIYMPDCYQVNSKREVSNKIFTRKDFGLPENAIVLASFNSPVKITSKTFDIWMRILKNNPRAVLWLFAQNDFMASNLKKMASQHDVDPDRLIFCRRLPLTEHLRRHDLADLALDTIGYSGGATTSHALWMGLPVITYPGRTYLSRMSASLVNAAGTPELIVNSEKEYIKLVNNFVTNPSKLKTLKAKLLVNRDTGSLFNTVKFVQNLEQVYRMIWSKYLNGQKPEDTYLNSKVKMNA